MSKDNLQSGTYEIIQNRLNEQKNHLSHKLAALNEDRKKVFGGIDFSLIANERISTEQSCKIKDLFAVNHLCIVGYNTHLGLKTEVEVTDVFALYAFQENRFEPQPITFLDDANFVQEFKNLYKYYRNTQFVRFYYTQNYLYFVFQLSANASDIKAFKWLVKDNELHFIDSRSASEVKYPPQHEFQWVKATRDMHRTGRHPHISLADKVFVEAIGGDITIKVEDNTQTGKGIYSEPVAHKDQTLDDAEVHFFDYDNLVLFKIKPYQEDERYFIYNHKEKKVKRVDSLKHSAILLPENQGVIYSNGFALQTGEIKVIETEDKNIFFDRKITASNGENFLFAFYDETSNDYALIPYNIINQTIDTPIYCNGFSLFDNGILAYLKNTEESKNHLVQLWQTPFTKELVISETLRENELFKIGNKDLVKAMADCQELIVLLNKKDSYAGLYTDIVKRATSILDNYYFLDKESVKHLSEPISEIRKIAHAAINEYEKVVEIRKNTQAALDTLEEKFKQLLSQTSLVNYTALHQFIETLSEIRTLRGEMISAKELQYSDLPKIEAWEQQLNERADELAAQCVQFLLQDDALVVYEGKINALISETQQLSKSVEAKNIEQSLDELALQLELLVNIVNNLKIDDASHSTQIIEKISVIFSQINQQRIELNNKKREISGTELSADFKAQITLFDQASINFLELANTPDKADEYLTKLSIQLEELETKFIDFEEFIQIIADKREEVYTHFQNKMVQLTEAQNRRTQNLFQSGERILKSIISKAESFDTEVEINGYFASDLMVDKLRELVARLNDLQDSNKAEELQTHLKTAQQDAIRKLKDKKEIYTDGENTINFGKYQFAVNQQKLDLSLVLRQGAYYYHITGTSFYEPLAFEAIQDYQEVWHQEFVSENTEVKKMEYLAWEIFLKNPAISSEETNRLLIEQFLKNHFGEGLVKGVHDEDALLILTKLQQLNNHLGLLRYNPSERALAQLFWFFLAPEEKVFYEKQFSAVHLLSDTFANSKQFTYLNATLSQKIDNFNKDFQGFCHTSAYNTAVYLKKEDRNRFVISKEAAELYQKFVNGLKEKGKDLVFSQQIEDLHHYPSACYDIVENALKTFLLAEHTEASQMVIEEASAFIITQNFHENQISKVSHTEAIAGLKSLDTNTEYILDFHDFSQRLSYYHQNIIPKFTELQKLKKEWIEKKKKELKLSSFKTSVLSSFVRNKLINEVYFNLIGANLAKQIGALGEQKRTDRMGMLLLVSPPGYGKTTLMEYVADRMGLVFMKINGPAIGHEITSTDPSEAKNAGARQELEKLNLALEMADNVMLYLDDIQHCNPEFLQKFISLADGQRKIEGIYNGVSKTYDMRSKRFCLVMAGNPYTESGDKFQIPDMLANRADIYNLGDISGTQTDLFELSLIENAITSNPYLTRLTQPAYQNLYQLYDAIQNQTPDPTIEGNFTAQEIADFRAVLEKIIQIRQVVLQVNSQYIQSAAMEDDYRTEPAFKLQGSYRDMSKLVTKVQPILSEAEVQALILEHYQNESQTLTTGAEANLLKLKEMMALLTETEATRWHHIQETFQKNKRLKGLGENDRMAQIAALLAEFSDGLKGIQEVLKRS
ncbi:DNA repair ATPase [Riemerella anatipestifer]|uniref:DNA repair ATPase n=1 Tax=Riemerella anatipestifer TaxID=34085 RepID=UPI001BDAAF95|nr:DNA repair ATPase [Riemerella anatipestifer]MBT0549935.1 DNA repair ATPase [Riemerella anatipestifer]MBT0560695.1 DNA repair ATPase [Riemerella anatipestifer]